MTLLSLIIQSENCIDLCLNPTKTINLNKLHAIITLDSKIQRILLDGFTGSNFSSQLRILEVQTIIYYYYHNNINATILPDNIR